MRNRNCVGHLDFRTSVVALFALLMLLSGPVAVFACDAKCGCGECDKDCPHGHDAGNCADHDHGGEGRDWVQQHTSNYGNGIRGVHVSPSWHGGHIDVIGGAPPGQSLGPSSSPGGVTVGVGASFKFKAHYSGSAPPRNDLPPGTVAL